MSYHKLFLFSLKENNPFTEKKLTHLNVEDNDPNEELLRQIETNNTEMVNSDLDSLKTQIAELTIDEVDLTRGNSLFDVLRDGIDADNKDSVAIEILDGLLDNGKITLEQARAPWRDFDKFKIENGNLVLSKRIRSRNLDAPTSYRELVNVDLSTTPSDTLTRLITEREIEEREVSEEVEDSLSQAASPSTTPAEIETDTQATNPEVRRRTRQLDTTPSSEPVQRRAPVQFRQAEGDTNETVRSLSTQTEILNAIDNITDLTSFNLPEDFQVSYNSRQFRSLMTSGRIANSGELIRNLDQLGVTTEQLEDILGYGSRGNVDAGLEINAGEFLQSTPFAEESLQQFLRTTLILEQIPDKDPEQTAELNQRRETFNIINRTVQILKNLDLIEVSNDNREIQSAINPDYIRRINFPDSVENQLSSSLDLRRFTDNKQKEIVALIVMLHGPLNNLISRGTISIDNISQSRNGQNTFELTLNNLDGINIDTLQSGFELLDEADGLDRTHRTLTDAIRDLSEVESITNFVRNSQFENAPESLSDNASLAYRHLNYMFNREETGMRNRNGNRSLEQFDTMGNSEVRVQETDYISQNMSESQMYQYVLSRSLERNNGTQVSIENLQTDFLRLAQLGQRRMGLDASLSEARRNELAAYVVPATLTLSSTPLDDEFISLVKYGILADANRDQIESTEEIDVTAELEAGVLEQLRNSMIPEEQIDRLARASVGLINSIDIGQIITDGRLGFGVDVNIPLRFSPDDEGQYQIINTGTTENPEYNFERDETGRTILTIGAGTAVSLTDASPLSTSDVGITVGLQTNVNNGVRVGGALSVRLLSGASARVSADVELGRGWTYNPSASAGVTFMGIPYGTLAPLAFSNGVDQRITNSVERVSERLDLGSITRDTWEAIESGNVLPTDIAILSNQVPMIQELINAYQEDLDPTQQEEAKVFFMQELANAILNAGFEEAKGIGGGFGLMFIATATPPHVIPVPYVHLEFITSRRRYASTSQSYLDNMGMAGQDALRDFHQLVGTDDPETPTTVTIDGVESFYDPITGEQRITERTGQLSQVTFETQEVALEQVNEATNSHGLRFSALENNQDFSMQFSLTDYTPEISALGLNQTTDIFVDPATGITIQNLGNNNYGIRFGDNPRNLPPNDLNIILQRVTNSHGRNAGISTAITFSIGDSPATAEDLYSGSLIDSFIRVDSNGTASEVQTAGVFDSDVVWLEQPFNTLPEITNEELTSLSDNTATILDLIEGDLGERTSTPEFVDQLNRFREEVSGDTQFLRELARVTTISIQNGDSELEQVADLIESKWIEIYGSTPGNGFTGADILDIASRLIPDTFRQLSDTSPSNRVEEVTRVINEISSEYISTLLNDSRYNFNYVDQDNNRVNFTEGERATIQRIIAEQATRKANDIADAITNRDLESNSESFDITNVDGIFTTAGLRRMGVQGFRQFLFGEDNVPSVITGSQTSFETLDIATEDLIVVKQFISNLYEPAIDLLEDLTTNMLSVREVLTSPSAIELIGMTMQATNNGGEISMVAMMYSPQEFAIFTNLYSRILSGDYPTTLTDVEINIMNHFLNTVGTIRGAHDEEINITRSNSTDIVATLSIQDDAGFAFIAECGNLTLYNDRNLSGTLTVNNSGFNVRVAEGSTIEDTNYRTEIGTFRVGLAMPVGTHGRDRGKENEAPPEDDTPPPDDEVPPTPDLGKEDDLMGQNDTPTI